MVKKRRATVELGISWMQAQWEPVRTRPTTPAAKMAFLFQDIAGAAPTISSVACETSVQKA